MCSQPARLNKFSRLSRYLIIKYTCHVVITLPKVLSDDLLGLVYHLFGDPCGGVPLEDVLKPEEEHLRELAAAGLEVSLQPCQTGRVLKVVGDLGNRVMK